MANRHKMHKKNVGGALVAGGNPNVIKEARQKNRGGALIARKEGGKVIGKKSGGRLDKRARGGGVGSDKHPFSSAKIKG